jgi:hypothetical protein
MMTSKFALQLLEWGLTKIRWVIQYNYQKNMKVTIRKLAVLVVTVSSETILFESYGDLIQGGGSART